MIQLNLLPDIKEQFIKTRRTRRLIAFVALVASSVSGGVMVLLFLTTNLWQTRSINDLTNDIDTKTSELQSINEISKILTVQNQLDSLPALHESKPAVNRLFTYLPAITPADVVLEDLELNFTTNEISIDGLTTQLLSANRFVDTLKFTEFAVDDGPDTPKSLAFNSVYLASSSIEGTNGVSFKISAIFDPQIFDTTLPKVSLQVPQITTTRSELEQPSAIFNSVDLNSEGEQ